MKQVVFHELARKELLDSRDYYDGLVYGLGKKFIDEVEYIVNNIKTNPLLFPIYFKDFRKALLRKFPFSIIYKESKTKIFILAVAHQKRKPKYWAKR